MRNEIQNPKSKIAYCLPQLYLITGRRQTLGRPLVDAVKMALEGGVRMVQVREKDLSGRELFNLAGELRKITSEYGARLLVNDRVDIAMAVDADGVHLPADSFSPGEARSLMGGGKIIGVSAHSIQDTEKAEKEGADFVTFSPIYHTPSKSRYGKPQGIERLREVCENVGIPVYALGGVKAENVEEIKKAGAYGVALISAIIAATDVRREAKKISGLLNG